MLTREVGKAIPSPDLCGLRSSGANVEEVTV